MNRTICGVRVRVEHSTGKVRPKPWMRGGRGGGGGGGPPRSRRPYDPSDRCFTCGEGGHYSYDCSQSRGGRDRSRYKNLRGPLLTPTQIYGAFLKITRKFGILANFFIFDYMKFWYLGDMWKCFWTCTKLCKIVWIFLKDCVKSWPNFEFWLHCEIYFFYGAIVKNWALWFDHL